MLFFARKTQDQIADHLDTLLERVDYAASLQHALASVASAQVIEKPFPYVILKNVFDAPTYEALLQLVQFNELFKVEPGGTAYTIYRYPEVNRNISSEVHAFMDFMAQEFNPALFRALLAKFSDSVLKWAAHLKEQGRYLPPAESMVETEIRPYGVVQSLREGMISQFEIMRRTQEFAISPHCHPIKELIIGLFPIVADNSMQDYGTDLFGIKAGRSPNVDMSEFSYVAPDIVEQVSRTKFLRNSAFIMLNADGGVHAYNPPRKSRHRNYLYTTLLIGDDALAPLEKASNQWYAKN
jgi:hypothetical protein